MAANPVTVLPTTFFIIFILTMTVIATTKPLPFVVFHGIVDECSSAKVSNFTQSLINWSGAQGYCVEIGNGYLDTLFMPLTKQTEIACEKVKNITELSDGYNIVAISQGNMVGRGVVEFCDGAPPVKNFISLGGPHAGVASAPCLYNSTELEQKACEFINYLLKLGVYNSVTQALSAPAGFIKIPTEIDEYLKGCEHDQDSILVPKETSWFGYYPDGSTDTVLPANETTLYTEDWIGLKTLDKAGNVTYITVAGEHANISDSDMKKYVVPYINGSKTLTVVESSFILSSSIWDSVKESVGFAAIA